MKSQRVVVIGSLNYDLFLQVGALPQVGETYQAQGLVTAAGGKGANQAVQCARLGMACAMVGAVGNDSMGAFLLERLRQSGVNTAHVRSAHEPTGLGVVHVLSDGGVLSTIVRGANETVSPADVDAAEPLIRDAFALIVQLEIPVETVCYAVETAHRIGVRVILNAAPALALPETVLPLCDTVIVNEVEASFYTGQRIRDIREAQAAIVPFTHANHIRAVFTLGAQGSVAYDGRDLCVVPPVPASVVETTGAGDSFVGGFVKAQSLGIGFRDSLAFAARCSAVTISRVGGQDAMPDLEQMKQFLKFSASPLSDGQVLL